MTKEDSTQARWHTEYVKQQRKYFEYSDTSQYLLEQKKEDDLLLLQDSFVQWLLKLKPEDERKKELTLLLQSIWRIQNYCGTLETVCKSSVVRVIELNKKIEYIDSEKRILELEISQLKSKHELEKQSLEKQIEFASKTS
jgi:hypothetical protein